MATKQDFAAIPVGDYITLTYRTKYTSGHNVHGRFQGIENNQVKIRVERTINYGKELIHHDDDMKDKRLVDYKPREEEKYTIQHYALDRIDQVRWSNPADQVAPPDYTKAETYKECRPGMMISFDLRTPLDYGPYKLPSIHGRFEGIDSANKAVKILVENVHEPAGIPIAVELETVKRADWW